MNASRFAATVLLSAFAAAPALSQTAALTPIAMGPAAAGQCVIGSNGCGLSRGSAMDPVAEDAIVGLGQRAVPTIEAPSVRPAPMFVAPKPQNVPAQDSGADLVAIGGRIINPAAAPYRPAAAPGAAAPAPSHGRRQGTFDTHVDGSPIATAEVPKATGLSYLQTQRVEATLGGKGAAFGADPKLSAGDADFSAGGMRASANDDH